MNSGARGMVAVSQVSCGRKNRLALEIYGTKAGLRLDPLTKITAEKVDPSAPVRMPWQSETESYRAIEEQIFPNPEAVRGQSGDVTKGFVDALVAGRQPWTPGADALEVTRVIDAAYRAAAEKRMVVLA